MISIGALGYLSDYGIKLLMGVVLRWQHTTVGRGR
jgi:hypothetical protein